MTPTTLRPRLVAAMLVAGLGLPAGAQAAVEPEVSTAPGRIVFSVDGGAVQRNVDATGATSATALPDGSTLLIGSGGPVRTVLYAAKIGLNGALDRGFGSGGVLSFPRPAGRRTDRSTSCASPMAGCCSSASRGPPRCQPIRAGYR